MTRAVLTTDDSRLTTTHPTLTRLGRRVERSWCPHTGRPSVGGYRHPRLYAIAWHRIVLRALAELEDAEAQRWAGQYHLQQLGVLLREDAEARTKRGADAP